MGVYLYKKYLDIYNKMEKDKWYKAAELGVAPASMTAMINRGMVDKTDTSPRLYRRKQNKTVNILKKLGNNFNDGDYFSLYPEQGLGMLCTVEKERILDCWGNPYNIDNSVLIGIGQRKELIDE